MPAARRALSSGVESGGFAFETHSSRPPRPGNIPFQSYTFQTGRHSTSDVFNPGATQKSLGCIRPTWHCDASPSLALSSPQFQKLAITIYHYSIPSFIRQPSSESGSSSSRCSNHLSDSTKHHLQSEDYSKQVAPWNPCHLV